MNFDKRYDRSEFLRFLESFLSEDFTEKIEEVHIDHKTTYIRQVTQGRGSFEFAFVRYEDTPANVAQKIIEKAKADSQE